MGKFEFSGKKKGGTESEEFYNAIHDEAGAVECWVCKIKLGQGNKGMSINVCKECIGYYCNDHMFRHPNCSEGR